MNKAELIKEIAERTGKSSADVAAILNGFVEVVGDELKEGNKVTLVNFGTFEARNAQERLGRNPRNPEEQIVIPAKVRPSFKASKKLKEKVNEE